MRTELLVSRAGGQTWAALREDGVTVELRVEDDEPAPAVGWVIRGRVENVLPGIQSAFIDIGENKNGFLHASEVLLPGEVSASGGFGAEEPDPADGPPEPPAPRGGTVPIERRLRPGVELIVQVAREGIQAKGARLSCNVALPGRYLVYFPRSAERGVSRRIADPEERRRLADLIDGLPGEGSFIVRTAGEGVPEPALRADAERLVRTWESIVGAADRGRAPVVLHRDLELCLRLLRDSPPGGLDEVVVDCPELRRRAVDYLTPLDPALAARVRLHGGRRPLLEAYGVDREIQRSLRSRVWLKSGGYVVIEETEALVSIDVNTGRFVGRHDLEDTVRRTNLEAADEIAHQLRLRDLGGIVVIDFIDMARSEDRRSVIERFETALRRDRARTKIAGLGELGLLQLTRKRTRPGVGAAVTRPCPTCAGRGRVKGPSTVAAEAVSEVRRLLAALDGEPVTVRVHPDAAPATRRALARDEALAAASEVRRLVVQEDPALAPDRFEVVAGGA